MLNSVASYVTLFRKILLARAESVYLYKSCLGFFFQFLIEENKSINVIRDFGGLI